MTWKKIATVHSESDFHKRYVVKVNEKGEYGCDCPAWRFKMHMDKDGVRTCKHVQAVLKTLGPAVKLIEWSGGAVDAEVDGSRFIIYGLPTEEK